VDLREYDLEDPHRQIAVIVQDFVRYDMTARENIVVGQITNGPIQSRSARRLETRGEAWAGTPYLRMLNC